MFRKSQCFIALFLALSSWLSAISVQIPQETLLTSGSGTNRNVFVSNPSEQVKAVEVSVQTRRHDLAGDEIRNDLENDEILVYPAQFLVYPGEERIVTVRWQGEPKLPAEQAYRLTIEEVDLKNDFSDEEADGATIKMLLRFVRSIYVSSEITKPRFAVDNAVATQSIAVEGEGPVKQLQFEFANVGTTHAIVTSVELKVSSRGKNKRIKLDNTSIPMPNLLAGDRRRVIVPWPSGLKGDSVSVELLDVDVL